MYKLADYECCKCGTVSEELVSVPTGGKPAKTQHLLCEYCNEHLTHDIKLALPAPYMGEKKANFKVSGGQFDTMGKQAMKDIPDLPGAAHQQAKMRKELNALPDNAPQAARKDIMRKHSKYVPSSADYTEHFKKPEVKEAFRVNKEIVKNNAEKQQRARALNKGENINFRSDKCKGDPNIIA